MYFARRYFAPRYWAGRYFPGGSSTPPGTGGGYLNGRYFAHTYFAARYFPLGATTPPPPVIIIRDTHDGAKRKKKRLEREPPYREVLRRDIIDAYNKAFGANLPGGTPVEPLIEQAEASRHAITDDDYEAIRLAAERLDEADEIAELVAAYNALDEDEPLDEEDREIVMIASYL